MKKKINNGWLYWLILALAIMILSCSKGEIGETVYRFDKYQMIVDHYSKDSSFMGVRTLWGQWYLPRDKNGGMDSIKGRTFLNCDTDSVEHLYYLVNDVAVSPAMFSKLKPSRTDTNWFNYNKQ